MIKIAIKYFGMITIKLNLHEEQIEIENNATFNQLVEVLKKKHGETIEKYINQGYQILLEREGKAVNIVLMDNFDTKLMDGDKILFVYVFAGG